MVASPSLVSSGRSRSNDFSTRCMELRKPYPRRAARVSPIYIYLYLYIYIYIHAYIHTYIHMHIHMHVSEGGLRRAALGGSRAARRGHWRQGHNDPLRRAQHAPRRLRLIYIHVSEGGVAHHTHCVLPRWTTCCTARVRATRAR